MTVLNKVSAESQCGSCAVKTLHDAGNMTEAERALCNRIESVCVFLGATAGLTRDGNSGRVLLRAEQSKLIG